MNEMVFYPSRTKFMFFSIVTFLIGLFFTYIPMMMLFGSTETDWITGIIFALIAIILLPVSYVLFKKAINKEDGVIINDKGISINVHSPKIGFIPWEDIEGCLLYSVQGQPMIGFIIPNEEEYVNRFNGISKTMLVANQKMGFPAINISLNTIKDKTGLLEALERQKVGFYEKEA